VLTHKELSDYIKENPDIQLSVLDLVDIIDNHKDYKKKN
jgi:hypothetical protein